MIDVKQLRIGSHILVDGERKEVKSTSNPWIFLDDDEPYHGDDLDPIPLTAELLQELGFEQEQSYFILTLPEEVTIYADAVEDEMGNWNIQIFATKLYKRGEVFVRYLHELETFIYLTIGKELVE